MKTTTNSTGVHMESEIKIIDVGPTTESQRRMAFDYRDKITAAFGCRQFPSDLRVRLYCEVDGAHGLLLFATGGIMSFDLTHWKLAHDCAATVLSDAVKSWYVDCKFGPGGYHSRVWPPTP